jgi:hypothetical protein
MIGRWPSRVQLPPSRKITIYGWSTRRHQFLAALTNRLRGRPADSGRLVPLDEIVGSLGWRSQRPLGPPQTIRLDTIAGTAGARRDFDRCFRPTSGRVRSRWERLALAQRRGEAIPPIEVYRVGHRHFVSDGHHRVSIAAATGQQLIDAYVTPGAHHGAGPDPDRQAASLLVGWLTITPCG